MTLINIVVYFAFGVTTSYVFGRKYQISDPLQYSITTLLWPILAVVIVISQLIQLVRRMGPFNSKH